jgi:hypothetical protein
VLVAAETIVGDRVGLTMDIAPVVGVDGEDEPCQRSQPMPRLDTHPIKKRIPPKTMGVQGNLCAEDRGSGLPQ